MPEYFEVGGVLRQLPKTVEGRGRATIDAWIRDPDGVERQVEEALAHEAAARAREAGETPAPAVEPSEADRQAREQAAALHQARLAADTAAAAAAAARHAPPFTPTAGTAPRRERAAKSTAPAPPEE